MKQQSVHKKFIFNEKIDSAYLFSLYEDDFVYITEVYGSCLESLNDELRHFTTAFESSDIDTLKKTAHKIKPLFGFTGLTYHQDMMQRFEQLCNNSSNASSVTIQYMEVLEVAREARNIIKSEYSRLTEFIS
jgi:hypothetical protein